MSNGAQHPSGNRYAINSFVPGIILYPALMTPAVVVGEEAEVHLLLLGTAAQPIQEGNVRYQLKFSRGLDATKPYQNAPLPINCVQDFTEEGDLGDGVLSLSDHFDGLVDTRAIELFRGQGYTKLYSVRLEGIAELLAAEATRDPELFNLIWVHAASSDIAQTPQLCIELLPTATSPTLNTTDTSDPAVPRLTPRENHDDVIASVLQEMNGAGITEQGRYCFAGGIPTDARIDRSDPVQSYHPLFYYAEREVFNLAHFSDVHLCARQHVMERSYARVIEYAVDNAGRRTEQDLDISRKIGGMVNINLTNMQALFRRINGDDDIQAVLIGGDLVDYIRSVYAPDLSRFEEPDPQADPGEYRQRISRIWDTVAINDQYQTNYHDFVDFISFYSAVLAFYRGANPKPIYVLTGNHDAYHLPYGVSPRVQLRGYDLRRANEGIPADHNLTFYEAILIFGDTYANYLSAPDSCSNSTNFVTAQLRWFYSVLTPFSDFALHLPKQSLIGIAWGDTEDMINVRDIIGGQGFGHLPRASSAITDRQRQFLEAAEQTAGSDRHRILTTHFTFVSYDNTIPQNTTQEGDVIFTGQAFGEHDLGTFTINRTPLYQDRLATRQIQCVLTGHSHRRALYTVNGTGRCGMLRRRCVQTGSLDFDGFAGITPAERQEPAIIVSDSAGPVPRRNGEGELFGWGSDRPGGTKLLFDATTGEVQQASILEAGPRPRFAVALDYVDLIAGERVVRSFESDPMDRADERMGTVRYRFDLSLHQEVTNCATVSDIVLYVKILNWFRIAMQAAGGRWEIPEGEARNFRNHFANSSEGAFMAIKFAPNGRRAVKHDFDSYWCFPVRILSRRASLWDNRRRYVIERHNAEIPDFNWRRNEISEKYI